MKIVYFKITGELYCRVGPCRETDNESSLLEHLARVFQKEQSQIKILEIANHEKIILGH